MSPTLKHLIVFIVLVAAACGGATGGEPSGAPETTVSDTTAPVPETTDGESEETPPTTDGNGGTFTFEHFAGTTEVPVDPQRIVTLQDQNALLPLLELGVKPVASAALDNGDGTHTFRRVESYDTTGIEFVGAYGEPDLELIAVQQPDLIVGDEFLEDGVYEQLSQIAPTVLISIFDRPLPEALEDFAALVGRQERHAELLAEYEQNVADLIADLPRPPEQIVVSRVQFGSDGTFFSPANTQAFGAVMLDIGFARPEAELEAINDPDYSYAESLERLSTRGEADVLITADFSADFGASGEEDPTIQAIREEPIFQQLDVVRRGEFHVFDGGATVGSAFEKMNNFIEFLRSILVDREPALRPLE